MEKSISEKQDGFEALEKCFRTPNGCSEPTDPNEWYGITLYDESGNSLNLQTGDVEFKVRWRPSCQYATTCNRPLVHLKAVLQHKDPDFKGQIGRLLNFKKYELHGAAGFALNTFANFCQAMGGVIIDNNCTFSFAGQMCGAGEIVQSINPFTCRKLILPPAPPLDCHIDAVDTWRIASVGLDGQAVCEKAFVVAGATTTTTTTLAVTTTSTTSVVTSTTGGPPPTGPSGPACSISAHPRIEWECDGTQTQWLGNMGCACPSYDSDGKGVGCGLTTMYSGFKYCESTGTSVPVNYIPGACYCELP